MSQLHPSPFASEISTETPFAAASEAESVGLRLGPYQQALTLVSSEAVADSVPPRSLFNL